MGIRNYHNTLIGSFYYEGIVEVGLWAVGGNFIYLQNPVMTWRNGSTYCVGFESNATNNQVWIIKQTGSIIEATEVGSGTTGPEPNNHPAPVLVIDDAGYLYVIQNEFHVDPFRLWRSDSVEDISSFTYIGAFDTNGAYLGLLKQNNTDCTFVTRSGGLYNLSVLNVDLTDASYTDIQVTDADFTIEQVRHYPMCPLFYGTSTYRVGGINHRAESPIVNYKMSLWVTADFVTFENLGQTFTKDVVATAPLTVAELETNFKLFGTDSDQSSIYLGNFIQINDDVYVIHAQGGVGFFISKYTIGTATAIASYTIPLSGLGTYVYHYYNGTNIVMLMNYNATVTDVYTIDLDLTASSFVYQRRITNLPNDDRVGLPSNLDEVDGKYIIFGRGTAGEIPYVITDNKWT
jgi:hypothetical protein